MKTYYVYILASHRNGKTYVGMTNNLMRRIHEHKTSAVEGYTKRHGIHSLVYFEETIEVNEAIAREKQLKKLTRAQKLALIEAGNPDWKDLFYTL